MLGLMGDQLLGRELLNLGSLSGELRHLGYILQPNLPCWTEQLVQFKTLLIAPASVGEDTCGGA